MSDPTTLGSLAQLALAWALTYLLHSTVLIGLTWAALRAARGLHAQLRARAWQVALVGGVLTASVQLGAGLEPLGGRYVLPALFGPAPAEVAVQQRPVVIDAASLAASAIPIAVSEAPARVAPPEAAAAVGADARWRRALAMAWLSGALYGLLRFASRAGRFRARVADRLPVWNEDAIASLERLRRRAGVRRPVRLTRSRSIHVPLTWGVRRPEICIPDRALEDLKRGELEAVLAHELGHIARGDALWLGIGQWIGAALFFQPLNRVARRGLAREAEHLADAFAIGLTDKPLTLARCLAKVAGWLERGGPAEPTATVPVAGMASSRGVLLERVERLLEKRAPRRPRRIATLAVACTPLALLPLAPAVAADAADRARAGDGSELRRPDSAPLPEFELYDSSNDAVGDPTVAALVAVLGELRSLGDELASLREHPAADDFLTEIEFLALRLDRLAELGRRAERALAAPSTNTPPRNASRGDALSIVPDRP